MKCPLKFARYEFEGGEECIGAECGFFGSVCDATNGIDGETNGIADEITLSEGGAVDMLRKYVEECESANGKAGTRGKRLLQIVDMVERDYVSRESIEGVMDTDRELVAENIRLKAEHDELTNAINELQKKQPYCYDHEAPLDTLRTVGRYIDELTAERDKLKKRVDEQQETLDVDCCDLIKYDNEVCKLTAERDEWKAKAEGSSKVRAGQSNLEWLLEHDRKAVADFLDCAVNMCNNCAYDKYRIDGKCPSGFEWLMAPHDDAHSKAQSTTEPNMSEQSELLSDDCGQVADMSQKSADCVRDDGEMSDSREKLDYGDVIQLIRENVDIVIDQLINDEPHDSREKLEADVREFWFPYNGMPSVHSKENVDRVLGWLDRQAAITERECCKYIDGAGCDGPEVVHGLNRRIVELQAKVDELERDNENLIRDLKEHKDYLDGWDMASAKWVLERYAKGELYRDSDVEAISLLDNDCLQKCIDELANEVYRLNAECECLRSKLGVALDKAHDISSLANIE